MSIQSLDSIDAALDGNASVDEVLDLVDDVIERATRTADAVTLTALADRVDAVAAERGGEWQGLAVAALRARAIAGAPIAEAPPAPRLPAPRADDGRAPSAYAGWWLRTGAFLLDWALLAAAYGLLAEFAPDEVGDAVVVTVWLGLPLAYFAGMHAANHGATAGKEVCGISVRGPDERGIGWGRAIGRAVATTVLWITLVGGLVDAVLLGTDRRKQALHDKIAGTVVVRTRGAPTAAV